MTVDTGFHPGKRSDSGVVVDLTQVREDCPPRPSSFLMTASFNGRLTVLALRKQGGSEAIERHRDTIDKRLTDGRGHEKGGTGELNANGRSPVAPLCPSQSSICSRAMHVRSCVVELGRTMLPSENCASSIKLLFTLPGLRGYEEGHTGLLLCGSCVSHWRTAPRSRLAGTSDYADKVRL